ncbi:Rrf2 family transcriptional regulator [Curvivirga aplysinae]|uniref:Rrf2 family transcriptional regulator n=1 Tax=Curvivirga aplysinae TaxID=2529852 RepID=UPI0012BD4516|nr:Rrf2 family transcriptional regulator [Curvivirga aplysinae]MTI09522.1 Rrf2 family transcriptional regulator [Curvivirga aplysinae]
MRLDTRSRYAIVAIVDMALHEDKGPITLSTLAEKQNISISYLEQIFAKLKKAGIVESLRGPGGGYVVRGDGKDITLADILRAVDPELGRKKNNNHHEHIEMFWDALHGHVADFFENITLHQVVQGEVRI